MTNSAKRPPESDHASTKPYLLRAIYDWAIDHQMTPQVLVSANVEGVALPSSIDKQSSIAINIHPQAVAKLAMGNHDMRFSARFAGKPFDVCIPVAAIVAIYCRENGQGISFDTEGDKQITAPAQSIAAAEPPTMPKKALASHLKLVK